jgi:hypothetical protein
VSEIEHPMLVTFRCEDGATYEMRCNEQAVRAEGWMPFLRDVFPTIDELRRRQGESG